MAISRKLSASGSRWGLRMLHTHQCLTETIETPPPQGQLTKEAHPGPMPLRTPPPFPKCDIRANSSLGP